MKALKLEILELIAGNTFYENSGTGKVSSDNLWEAGDAGVGYDKNAGSNPANVPWPDFPDGNPGYR